MSKKIEILVNTQCDGNVTLARIRGASDAKSLKFTNDSHLKRLAKGDGAVVEVKAAVEKGNYIVPTDYRIIDTHVSGTKINLDSYMESLEKTAPPF